MALRMGIEGAFAGMHTASTKLLEVIALTAKVRSQPPSSSRPLHTCVCSLTRRLIQGPAASQKLADASAAVVPTLGGAEGSAQLAAVAADVAKGYSVAAAEMEAIVKPRAEKLGKMTL